MRASHLAKLAALFLPVAVCASSVSAQKMYFATNSAVKRANLDGSNLEPLVIGVLGAPAIAIDSDHGKMYWTDAADGPEHRRIRRANLDGSGVEDHVLDVQAFGIALDVHGNKMYFTNQGVIQRANLEGTDVQDIVTTGNAWGLALDIPAG